MVRGCRRVLGTLSVTFFAVLLALGEAQEAKRVSRIGFVSTASPGSSPANDAFRQGLRDLGYVEDQNVVIEWRWGRGRTERFPEFVAELVKLKVDVIVAANDAAAQAARKATTTVPIVVALMGDPVGSGLVATLARPGGNITGLTSQSPDTAAKRLQLLREAVPGLSRVALLADTNDLSYRLQARELEAAARALGIQLQLHEVSSPAEFNGSFTAMVKEGARGVFAVGGTMLYANRARLADEALKSRLPTMCGPRETVEAGCLMGYSVSLPDLFRRTAYFVDRILKGARPGDLPVEQPTRFELALNLKTAKALGLTIPSSLLQRADHVVE